MTFEHGGDATLAATARHAGDSAHPNVVPLPQRSNRAYELLAAQPVSLEGLDVQARNAVVISAIADDSGNEFVVSRFGEALWDFQTAIDTPNTTAERRGVRWPTDVNKSLVNDVKAAVYAWWKQGRPGWKPTKARSVVGVVEQGFGVLRFLSARGLGSFEDLRPIHLADYVQQLQAEGVAARGIRHRLIVIDLVACFRRELCQPPPISPWGRATFQEFCGLSSSREDKAAYAKTPVIPPSVQAAIFTYAEKVLAGAHEVLDRRDAGRVYEGAKELVEIRDAVLFLLQISTGMRNSEATGVKAGSWRTEVKSGVTYCWVRTFEHKTGKGLVDFLATPETLAALDIAQRYAQPQQARLRTEIAYLESELVGVGDDAHLSNSLSRTQALQRLRTARASVDNVFLTIGISVGDLPGSTSRINPMALQVCGVQLTKLATSAGVDWPLANHQCRRTFAWNVAQSRLGRHALIFLKWQFKHSSISMTELYASNALQDDTLYDEFYEEVVESKARLLDTWFDADTKLSGGAGRKIVQNRATRVADRASLLRYAAETSTVRATGHGWCLAEQRGCVGEGMYEATRCVDCSAGVIDPSHAGTWQQIHAQNVELLRITDCGAAVMQRAAREVRSSEKVLQDLGVLG